MRPRGALALPILLLALAACADDLPDGGQQPSDPGSAKDSALRGRTFVSTAVTVEGEPRPLVGGTSAVVGFTDDGVTLRAGCNQMTARAAYADGRLTVDGMGGTEMGCAPALMDQDAWLAGFLAGDPRYVLDGDTLRLIGGGTAMTFAPQADQPDLELTGTRWRLDGIVDGAGAGATVGSVPGGSSPVLVVTADGWLTADLGCNSGGGRVRIEGETLNVRRFLQTAMRCLGGSRSEVERLVSRMIGSGPLAYDVTDDTLMLTRGRHSLIYRAD
jgi:heat shock protein HslJ